MYLKSLELFGFKSFPEKTVLKFDCGITVIVGPNGCGKSNIFDAIKWALGEQSPKSLRGSKMEDVIFSGTYIHTPLNYTEVTLMFSNEDNCLPIDYKEVAITRRLYRLGESQYFINKNTCRLKDVEDLFLGTGIGEASYSFIEQGKVETFLSYKPEEKRLIFDEASGIVKYKEKKKETLKKLKDTEDNILRLDDIISEVKRQIRYLERQVEKAKKYKEINQKLIEIEKKLATLKLEGLENKVNIFLDEINSLKEKDTVKEREILENNTKLEEFNKTLKEMRQNYQKIDNQIISVNSHIENYLNHIHINNQRIKELESRISNLDNSIEEANTRVSTQNKRIEEGKNSVFSLEKEEINLEEGLKNLKGLKEGRLLRIKEARQKIPLEKKNILNFEEQRINVNNNLIELGAHLKNILARKKRLLLDKARIDNYLLERQEKLRHLEKELGDLKDKFDFFKKDKHHLSTQLREALSLIGDLEKQYVEKEKILVELNSYFEFLKDLKIKYDEFPLSKKVTIIFKEKPHDINKLIVSLEGAKFDEMNEDRNLEYRTDVEAKVISLSQEELRLKIESLNKDLQRIQEHIQNNRDKQAILNGKLSKDDNIILELDKTFRQRKQEENNLDEEVSRFKEEFGLIEKELQDSLKDIEGGEKKEEGLKRELSILQNNLDISKNNLEESQNKFSIYSEEVNKLEIEITRKEAEIKALGDHRESVFSKLSLLEEEKKNLLNTLSALEEEKETSLSNINSLVKEIEYLKSQIVEKKDSIESLGVDKKNLEMQISSLEKEFEGSSSALKDLEKDLEDIRKDIYTKKLEIQKLDFEKTKIFDYLRQVYNIDFVLEKVDLVSESLEKLQKEKEGLNKKIDSLGEVNLVAIDEFEELNSRFNFLNTQKEDLLASKENLKKAIQKINRTSREVFLNVFTKIEEEFKKYFRFLFGGGKAQLILLDKEDILESGVEIEVQPPGKKLQNVSLLSGGEKALAAIALIFSIFKVKPSPLCVLDEIDAPLDESNVDRFNQLLKEFSPASQFIIITHNKRTMSKAEVLYGVTMEEKGISKLVSVRFVEEGVVSQPPASGPRSKT